MSRRKPILPIPMLSLAAASAVLAWGGYEVSHYRAGMPPRVQEVLAAAGGDRLLSREEGERESRSRISSLSVFSNVALHVKDNYVEPERIRPGEMLREALKQIERQVAEVLVEETGPDELVVRVLDQQRTVTTDDVKSLWEINLKLREVFRFFERHLPPQDDMRVIEYAAVNGALSTLDPHSVLLQPEAFAEMKTSTKGEFGGLGIVISSRDGKLTVVSPIDDTPASRAGIRSGDVITRIGDVSTVSMAIEEAVQMLRGPEGSEVTIWVDRKGWSDPRRFVIVRELIKIESVDSELLSSNVGYIKIKNFQQNTGQDLEANLGRLKRQAGGKLKGLILDLRNNPGGLLEQAIRVSDKFLTSGDIVTTVGYGNQLREPKRARWSGTEADLPIAVLINRGSASASEIVAGALKNLNRAVLIGERSFGKGSVQVLYDFTDSSALKLTIAQYLTPGGVSIQSEGVVPDIALKPAWLHEDGVRVFYEADANREQDLEQHLERIRDAKAPRETRPQVSMTYVVEPDDPDGDPPESSLDRDFEVQFARGFLEAAGQADRLASLREGTRYLERMQGRQEERLVERAQDLGVDWSWKASDPAKVRVKASLRGPKPGRQITVSAGDEVELTGVVENVGQVPVYRVRGVLESEHPAFRGRELLFGSLAPGERREWVVRTTIPKESETRSDMVDLVLATDEGTLDERPSLAVVTETVPHPHFAYSWVVDDRANGDGDGRLERGEGIDLRVWVENTGPGTADELSVRLKSGAKENLFLERGRTNLGELKAHQTAVATLRFRVPEEASTEPLPLEVTIYDGATGEWMEDQFALKARPQNGRGAADRKGWVRVRSASPARVRAEADADSPVLATLLPGTAWRARALGNGFVRIHLSDEASAYVPADSVEWKSPPEAKPVASLSREGLQLHAMRRQPSIQIDGSIGGKVVSDEKVRLEGSIFGRRLRDMYVLLNGDKVLFKSGPSGARRDAPSEDDRPAFEPPNERAVRVPFTVDLKLEEGLNKVLVVARLDERVVSYRSLLVSRRSDREAVAESKTPEPTRARRAAGGR